MTPKEIYMEWTKAMKALNNLMTHYYRVLIGETKNEDLLAPAECYQILKSYIINHTEEDKNEK